MMMRISWGRVRQGSWDDYQQAYERVMAGEAGRLKGLRGRWLARDTADTDAGYTMSLWDSEEDYRAYEQSDAYREITAALQPYFSGEYRTSHCQVTYSSQ
jgi:heme-degrading monooxygenase HmoA